VRLPDPEGSRAVVVGAAAFHDDALPDLPAVRDDVTGLAGVLTSPAGTGLPAEHCVVVAGDAGPIRLGERIVTAAAEAEDLLLLYYAGHGLLDGHGRLHLALPSTDPNRPLWTGFPFAAIRETFAEARARTRVVILDCRYSGRVSDGSAAGGTLAGQLDMAGTYTLTAATADETARAPSGAGHTTFTGELLTLLTEGDPEGADLLTLGHIYQRLRGGRHRRGLPVPDRCGTRDADALALTVNHAHRLMPEDVIARYAAHVRAWTSSVGPDHPEVLALRDEHAHAVGESGAPAEAARLYAALAVDAGRVLGAHHPETSRARENHAAWTARAGDPAGAARLSTTLVADRTTVTRVGSRRADIPRVTRKDQP
jgi:caspase domain-containing protein